jgi:pimeloyl-ACP methyl ester carboxylesterase
MRTKLIVLKNVAVWIGGSFKSDLDIWFLPCFAGSHLCFREAFSQPISREARILLFDPPGSGASPPRDNGLKVADCAAILQELIARCSGTRAVVLVGHSMSVIIATQTAELLERPPSLVVSVEGNLTKADAFLTGQASEYKTPEEFYSALTAKVFELVGGGLAPMRYYASLQFADPFTLWTLGRSVLEYEEPGKGFVKLGCPSIHYWDIASTLPEAREFLLKTNLRQRRLDGLGHWPMLKSPERFYAALREDVISLIGNVSVTV